MNNLKNLLPNVQNPRRITDEKLKMMEKSLKKFGELNCFVFNRRSKQLLSGHQRQKVMLEGNIVIERRLDEPSECFTTAEGYVEYNGERFKYREVDMDDPTEKAANIAANRHGGEFDLSALNDWLNELDAMNVDMDLVGFTEEDLENLMASVTHVPPSGDPDHVPSLPKEPKTKLGDIYQLGNHRLMCGDSTNIDAVEKLMGGKKADMVFTDPPYGMFLDADYSSMSSKFKGSKGGNKYEDVKGDHADFTPDLINTVFASFPYCKEVFLWGADYYSELLPNKNAGSWIVWDKRGDESADKMFGSTFELCWSLARHKREIARIKWAGIFGMEKEHDKSRVHPTQKPVLLIEWFFEKWGNEGDVVADLYGGSGSTLLASEKSKRKAYLMELDPKYCDVIVARWTEYTKREAFRLEEDGSKTAWSDIRAS
jgi:DNA modification methylase